MMDVYERAWKMLQERLEEKTSWGRSELKKTMAECLQRGLDASRHATFDTSSSEATEVSQ